MAKISSIPQYIVDRFHGWRASKFENEKAWYKHLVEGGQRPRTMVVACCDSRVDINTIFAAEPGEIFVMRNVANLVPPYGPDGGLHGASAAIEYAVRGLKIAHIIILGHSSCGGVSTYHDICAGQTQELVKESEFIAPWLELLRPAYAKIPASCTERHDRVRALEMQTVITSLDNLLTFPFITGMINEDKLTIHGAYFDIGEGALWAYDDETANFIQQ